MILMMIMVLRRNDEIASSVKRIKTEKCVIAVGAVAK